MQEADKRNQRKVPKEFLRSRNAVINACGIDTCIPEHAPYYELSRALARAWGSNVNAIMLFIAEDWLRGRKNWYPIIVEKTKFAPGFQRYFAVFNPKHHILCDFSIDFVYGGSAQYDPERQEILWQEALADPSLKERLEAGIRKFGMRASAQIVIEVFTQALREGRKHKPEELFNSTEVGSSP